MFAQNYGVLSVKSIHRYAHLRIDNHKSAHYTLSSKAIYSILKSALYNAMSSWHPSSFALVAYSNEKVLVLDILYRWMLMTGNSRLIVCN